jgi:predicted transcriptional regulator
MEILYRLGRASVSDVRDQLRDPPSYSSVRTILRILEEKGHLHHEEEGRRFLYLPVVSREAARHSALAGIVHNFFDGSRAKLMAALLDDPDTEFSKHELDALARMIKQARSEGR